MLNSVASCIATNVRSKDLAPSGLGVHDMIASAGLMTGKVLACDQMIIGVY